MSHRDRISDPSSRGKKYGTSSFPGSFAYRAAICAASLLLPERRCQPLDLLGVWGAVAPLRWVAGTHGRGQGSSCCTARRRCGCLIGALPSIHGQDPSPMRGAAGSAGPRRGRSSGRPRGRARRLAALRAPAEEPSGIVANAFWFQLAGCSDRATSRLTTSRRHGYRARLGVARTPIRCAR